MAVEGGYGSAAQFQLMARAAESATGQVGRLVQNIAAIQGVVGTVTFAARAFSQLEQQLTLTNAVAEGTGATFRQMEKTVRDAALAMKFSATEGANALYFLASAGLSVQQSISALQGVMVLAQATMTDVGTAADTIAGALSAFQLRANQSTRVANLFAAAIAQSQADINKLAFSFRQVAPVAGAMGVSIEKTTAALSVLYNVGLRGEQAGTALRNILVNLSRPTDEAAEALYGLGIATKTADGQARDLFETINDLSKANPNAATLTKLFGLDALAGAQALINAADSERYQGRVTAGDSRYDKEFADRAEQIAARVGKTAKDIRNELELTLTGETGTNAAFTIAAQQMATLSGSFATAKNAAVELGISLGQTLAPTLQTAANIITDLGVAFRGLSDHQQEMITKLPLIAGGIYAVTKAAGPLMNMLRGGLGFAEGTSALAMGAAGLAGARGSFQNSSFNQYRRDYESVSGVTGWRSFGPALSEASKQANKPGEAGVQGFTAVGGLLGRIAVATAGSAATLLLLYEVGKAVYDFVKTDRKARSDAPVVDLGNNLSRQAQSILLTGTNAYEREQQLRELAKSGREQLTSGLANQGVYGQQYMQAGNQARSLASRMPISELSGANLNELTRQLLGEGGKALSVKQIRDKFRDDNTSVLGFSVDRLSGVSDEDIKKLSDEVVKVNQAKSNVDAVKESIKGLQAAVDSIGRLADTETQNKDYAANKQTAVLSNAVSQDVQRLQSNFVDKKFIQEFERAAREAENVYNQLRAKLTNDPFESFVNDVATARYEAAKRVTDITTRATNDIRQQFSSQIAGKGDVAAMLSGAEFAKSVLQTDASGKEYYQSDPTNMQQNVAAMLERGGFTKEQILARYDAVVAEAMARINTTEPQTLDALRKVTAANRKTFEKLIETRELEEVQQFRTARQDTQSRRDYVIAMRERLVQSQNEIYRALAAGASEIDPTANAQQALRELFQSRQSSKNQLQEFEDAYFRMFAPDTPVGQRANTPAGQEFEKYRENFNRNLNALFSVGIDNIVRDARAARAKALDTLRTNASDIKAQQAQIAAELYTFTGDPSFLAEAVTVDARRATADIDRQIAGLRERGRTLTNGLGRLNASQGLDLPGVPELQVPAATLQFQNKSTELLQEIANNTSKTQDITGTTGFANTGAGNRMMPGGSGMGAFGIGGITGTATALTGKDLDMVVRTVYGEAAGEQARGWQAVAEVIMNRMTTWGKSGTEIVKQPRQFTVWDEPKSVERMNNLSPDSPMYKNIEAVVRGTFAGELGSLTGGAMNYLNAKTVRAGGQYKNANGLPNWAQGEGQDIGNHTFFNRVGGGRTSVALPEEGVVQKQTQAYREQATELEKLRQIAGTYTSNIDVMVEKLREQGATEQQIAAIKKEVATGSLAAKEGSEKEISAIGGLITRLQELKAAKLAYLSSAGYQAYSAWQLEGQNIDAMGKSLERYGTVADGIQFAFTKMRHNASTDFQLASEAMTGFMDKGAGLITGLIMGTEKDWKAAAASMLREIAAVIMKALIMRSITGIMGGSGDQSGGGIMSLFSGLFGGGAGGSPTGGVRLFANGGVVLNSLRNFKSADGASNKAAETGSPEAILPLRRGKGGRLGVEIAGDTAPTILPIVQPSARGGVTSMSFNPTFAPVFSGGGGGGQGGQMPDPERMASMQRDFDQSMEATFLDLVNKHSKPGGVLHGQTVKYGQA